MDIYIRADTNNTSSLVVNRIDVNFLLIFEKLCDKIVINNPSNHFYITGWLKE